MREMNEEKQESNLQDIKESMHRFDVLIGKSKSDISNVIQKIAQELICLAYLRRTTDVHIIIGEKKIKFRENGKLITLQMPGLSKELLENLTRYFLMQTGSLNATTKDFFHGGSFLINIQTTPKETEVSCRLSTIPGVTGQVTVIRLRNLESLPLLNELGLAEEIEKSFRSWVVEKYVQGGVIIVTGPTGSGKSTTLLSLMWEALVESEFTIAIGTIEHPVEILVPEFRQLDVNTFGDVSFESALRHFLRQDLDAVLVGEIRDDPGVARKVFEFAMTGHLAFTTLHTTTALAAITRLRSLGVPGDILAERVLGIASQRLMHGLCPNCKKESVLSEEDLRYFDNKGYNMREKAYDINPDGCNECGFTGVEGKIPIVELFLNTPEAKIEFLKESDVAVFEVIARKQGMKTMLEYALEEVLAGNISPKELKLVLVTPQDYAENS